MKKTILTIISMLICVMVNAQFASAPAFPGAEGYGRYTTGGRGGTVYHVTTLEDYCDNKDYTVGGTDADKDAAIPGSLRYGIKQSGARIIVFDVAGTIELKAPLKIQNDDITILGQTAPGDGICLKNYTVGIFANNVIIRYIRCRMGDEGKRYYSNGSALTNTAFEDDAMNAYQKTGSEKHNIIIDHCSISWCVDECGSFYGNENFTLQWCMLSESLRNSVHDKGAHGYGGIWGGSDASFHHNLLAHHDSRMIRFDHDYVSTCKGPVDYVNNVVYNWGSNSTYGGESSNGTYKMFNMVNNYYKPGPATKSGVKTRLLNPTTKCDNCTNTSKTPTSTGTVTPGHFYLSGNYMYGSTAVTNDNTCDAAIDPDSNVPYTTWKSTYLSNSRFTSSAENNLNMHSAENAFTNVINYAGASLKRDAVDTRIANETKNGTYTFSGSNGSTGGLIDTPSDVGGYPTLTGTKATDTDGDGIPDEWEDAHELDKNDASDALTYTLDKNHYYQNIEVYANYLVQDITKAERAGATETFDEYYPLDSDDPAPTQTVITASPASVNITGTANTTVTLSSNNSSGAYSISTQPSSSVATASINGSTITVTGVAAGSTSLTVTQAATTGYTSATKTINITVTAAQGGGDTPAVGTLTWDYTSTAPSSSPDNNLYYNQTVNDASGTNNGLKGIKMDSSGYAYFTKSAVAGTLFITYGVRKDNNTLSLSVYSTATAGTLNTTSDEFIKTSTASASQTFDVELTASQNNIYIKRASGSEGVITKIVFTPATPDHDATYDKNLGSNSYTIASGDKAVSGTLIVGNDITMTYGNDTWNDAGTESTHPTDYTYQITGTNSPSPSNGAVPTSGCYYKFQPTMDGTLNIAMLVNANKAIYVVENGTSIGYNIGSTEYSAGSSLLAKTGDILSFPVTADRTYYVYASGSRLGLFGWTLEENSVIEDPDPDPVAVKPAAKKVYDFVVGRDGDINAAIAAANVWTGSGRYLIFVPDGRHKMTGNATVKTKDSYSKDSEHTYYKWDESTGSITSGLWNTSTDYTDNAMTWLEKSNVSIIGQSMDGTEIYNIPYIPGISYTSTLEIRSGYSNTYLQDFTLKNLYAGGANDKGVAVAFYDRGTNTIAKNLNAWSNQDTYTSAATRCYYETSTFAGTVDFICGSGDVWFEQCDLVINNRSGNVITAPSTQSTEDWGYVFNHCTISKAEGATLVTDKNWNLGRPWKEAPASTFINTMMNVLPKDAAWTNMNDGLAIRFHEYGSVNSSGTAIDLSTRSVSACNGATADNPVLTEAQASRYKVSNVLAGDNNWDPRALTLQVGVSNVQLNGSTLSWDANGYALCWVVFKDGVFYDDVTESSISLSESGTYTVRAANSMGGLGEESAGIEYAGPVPTYTVSYNLKDHGASIADVTDVTALPATLPTSTADGWAFWGWFTDEACTNTAVAGATISKNTTLYAKWSDASTTSGAWSIDFSAIGNTESLADKAGVVISSKVARINSVDMGVIKMGNTYVNPNFVIQTGTSWIYRTAQKAIYSSNSGPRSFGMRNMKAGQIITMKATSIDGNGNVATTTITPTNATLESSANDIYVYNVTADGDVAFSINRYSYIYSIEVSDAPTPITYNVKFYNGAEQFGETQQIETGQTVSAPSPAPTKSGYTFRGWSVTDGGTTAETFPYTVTANVDFYAVFVEASTVPTTNLFSYTISNKDNVAGTYLAVGGTTTIENGGKIETKEDLSALKLDSDSGKSYVKCTLSRAISVGDEITVKMYTSSTPSNENPYGISIGLQPFTKVESSQCTKKTTWEDISITIDESSGLIGAKEIYLFRNNGQSTYIAAINVKTLDQITVTATVASTRKFGSFSSVYNVDFGNDENADVKAYTAVVDGTSVNLSRHTGVLPAGEGVVLYAPGATKSQTFNVVNEATALSAHNDMIGVPVATNVDKDAGGPAYVVNSDAFRPLSQSGTIAAGKAYIRIPEAQQGRVFTMTFNDWTTGICDSVAESNEPSEMKIYNLQGIEVKTPVKGRIYIINNKKCLFK